METSILLHDNAVSNADTLSTHSIVISSYRETYIEREKEESSNDRNDRAIRVAARWDVSKLTGMVTNYLSLPKQITNLHLMFCVSLLQTYYIICWRCSSYTCTVPLVLGGRRAFYWVIPWMLKCLTEILKCKKQTNKQNQNWNKMPFSFSAYSPPSLSRKEKCKTKKNKNHAKRRIDFVVTYSMLLYMYM